MCIPSKRVQYQTQVIVVQVSFPISPGRFLGIHTTKMRHASIYLTVFWSQDQTSGKIAENAFPSPSCSQLLAVSQSWISLFLCKMDTFHCSKTIQKYCLLQRYNAYSSPPKKNHLISFFLHTASFLQTLPIKQSPNPQNLDRRIQMFVAICQLGPSTRCTNLSSAIVQICQTCRIIEWLAQAFGNAEQSFVGVGSIWLWCPFFVGQRPILRIWIQKK